MTFFPDLRTFIQIGPVSIAWYAICILTGIVAVYFLISRNIRKMGYSQELFDSIFMGALVSGILGARLWYVAFFEFSYYISHPLAILEIWNGGLAIQGGLVFGAGFVLYYAKKHRLNFFRFADAILPYVILAQAAGRWGNFFNQEAYGRVVSESFYRFFPAWFKEIMFIDFAYREPTFLYESAMNILGFILIIGIFKHFRKNKRGDLAYFYLIWYGITRFIIEGFRSDSLMFMNLRVAQLTSIVFIIVGVLGILGLFRRLFRRQKPVILFDFDGTLMDTEAAITQTFVDVFKKHDPDYQLSDDEKLSFIGPSLRETFGRYFPDKLDEVIEDYQVINKELHKTLVKPMPHAVETLAALKEGGYSIGVVTSKRLDAILWASDRYDMTKYFEVIITPDEVTKTKPDPEGILTACRVLGKGQDELIYVGDVETDIEAGRRAGGYTFGYQNPDSDLRFRLSDGHANRLISDLYDIVESVKEDHEWTYNMM